MQVDLLKRWRGGGRQDRDLFEALIASVNGIAQACRVRADCSNPLLTRR